MGAWGTEIFDDDVACDVREDYAELLGSGVRKSEATRRVLEEYEDELEDSEDRASLWIALAAAQLEFGPLDPKIKEMALAIIESGEDLASWQARGASSEDIQKRQRALTELGKQLRGPDPPPRAVKPSPTSVQRAAWPIGDVLSYRTRQGSYVALRILDHYSDADGEAVIAGLFDWRGNEPPTAETVEDLPVKVIVYDPDESDIERDEGFILFQDADKELPTDRLELIASGFPRYTPPEPRAADWSELEELIEEYLPAREWPALESPS